MQADENCAALRISSGRALVNGGSFVGLAREHNEKALALELRLHGAGQGQRYVLLQDAAFAARAGVGAAVASVEYHHADRWPGRRRWRLGRSLRRLG